MKSLAARIVRQDAITECLGAIDRAIGKEPPHDQTIEIIAALRALRSDAARVPGLARVDYLERVQQAAQNAWQAKHGTENRSGVEFDAVSGTQTPLGRLKAVTWRRAWSGKRGEREVWASEYYLDDEPVTVAEIREAGLARRPHTRQRRAKPTA